MVKPSLAVESNRDVAQRLLANAEKILDMTEGRRMKADQAIALQLQAQSELLRAVVILLLDDRRR